MSKGKLIGIKIDVSKIDKSRLFQGKKGTYLDADLWINEEPDQFGSDGSISMSQTKEERDRGDKKIYIGSSKKVFGWESEPASAAAVSSGSGDDDGDSIPF